MQLMQTIRRQDALYARGGVTGARGGESFHNYGLAADVVFHDDQGALSWGEEHDWDRLGEVATDKGMSWGGDFPGLVDRPHVEYHPGLENTEAWKLGQPHATGGLDAAWDQLRDPGDLSWSRDDEALA